MKTRASSTRIVRAEMQKSVLAARARLVEYQALRKDAAWTKEVARVLGAMRRAFPLVPAQIYLSPNEATIYNSMTIDSFTDKKFVRAVAKIDAVVPFTKTVDFPEYANRDYKAEVKVGERLLKVTISVWLSDADNASKACRRVLKDVTYERRPVFEFVCA
jgi:hypothetical protein